MYFLDPRDRFRIDAGWRGDRAMSDPGETFTAKSRADLLRAIAVTEAVGGIGLAHLLKALKQGRIAFLPAPADPSRKKFKNWVRITAGRPAVALIGDDDGLDQGPSGWPIADRAVAWAKSILIHAAGAEISHYEKPPS